MMSFEQILTTVIAAALSSGVVGFIFKAWVDFSIRSRLAETDAKNRILAQEHQVRFTRYDERVASAIEEMHAQVCGYAEAAMTSLSAGTEHQVAAYEHVEALAERFRTSMHRHSIYLPAEISQKLTAARSSIRDTYTKYLDKVVQERRDKDRCEGISLLSAVYRNAGFQQEVDEVLQNLNELIRSHLSRFNADS